MTRFVVLLLGLVIPSTVGCSQKNAYDTTRRPDAGPVKVVGVIPEKFDCKAFLADAAQIAGGEVDWIPPEFAPQQGTAPPCGFLRRDDQTKAWQFTIDCRPVVEGDLDLLMKSKAGEPDTKMPAIGRKAIDHSRAQLVFLDDDTPCAVWIVGPDEASRASLATAIMGRLNKDNAPTHPRGQTLH